MFYMIKIKISFYIKSIKDSKYMFPFPTCTKCSSKNKVLNILKRQTCRIVFLNNSRLKPQNTACEGH
jgi:hypothetical protein